MVHFRPNPDFAASRSEWQV